MLDPSYFVRALVSVKSTVKILSIFVAFLENMNFNIFWTYVFDPVMFLFLLFD